VDLREEDGKKNGKNDSRDQKDKVIKECVPDDRPALGIAEQIGEIPETCPGAVDEQVDEQGLAGAGRSFFSGRAFFLRMPFLLRRPSFLRRPSRLLRLRYARIHVILQCSWRFLVLFHRGCGMTAITSLHAAEKKIKEAPVHPSSAAVPPGVREKTAKRHRGFRGARTITCHPTGRAPAGRCRPSCGCRRLPAVRSGGSFPRRRRRRRRGPPGLRRDSRG